VTKLDWNKANRAEMPKVARPKTQTQKRQEAVTKAYENGTTRERQRIIKLVEDSFGKQTSDIIIELIKGDAK
jgi:hypothetical protein